MRNSRPLAPINETRSSVAGDHLAVAAWGSALIVALLVLIAVIPLLPPLTLHVAIRIALITIGIAFGVLAILFHLTPPKRSKDGF
jgi:hypothetical protein